MGVPEETKMNFDNIPAGKDLPNDIYVIIEIPAESSPVKYEIDKDSDSIFVELKRLASISMGRLNRVGLRVFFSCVLGREAGGRNLAKAFNSFSALVCWTRRLVDGISGFVVPGVLLLWYPE